MGKLAEAIESYRRWLDEGEQRGEVTLSVESGKLSGTEVEVTVGRRTVRADEPKRLGGSGTAPNPVGYLMAAVCSCEAIGLSYWSDILDIPFDSAQVHVEGDIDPGGAYGIGNSTSPTFSDMRIEVRISGSEPKESYEVLMAKVNSHSPLLETLNTPIPVSTTLIVN